MTGVLLFSAGFFERLENCTINTYHSSGVMDVTVEIAVMNKMGVALAADSAVTIGSARKIFNSANKLFMLSKSHPVGIMVYGNAETMGYPWEVLVKSYRRELGDTSFPSIAEQGEHFIGWLEHKLSNVPKNNQDQHCERMIFLALAEIEQRTRERVRKLGGQADDSQLEECFRKALEEVYHMWQEASLLPNVPANMESFIMDNYRDVIGRRIDQLFRSFSLDDACVNKLFGIATMCFVKKRFSPGFSGVVIAGFGDEQDFPALVAFRVDGVINGWLKYELQVENSVNCDQHALVIPFAQQDVVRTFMEGIEPSFQGEVVDIFKELLREHNASIFKAISDSRTDLSEDVGKAFEEAAAAKTLDLSNEFLERCNALKMKHIGPVVKAISVLPLDELASAAESLVNLTSFKRKVSMDLETVGGPVDVAVISKGDGFIWIKRKHYFRMELNQHYLINSYRDDMRGGRWQGD